MPLEETALDAGVDGVTGIAAQLSIHTADPGAAGDNEVAGGGYARVNIIWDPSTGAIATATGLPIAFLGPPLSAATHLGLWTSGGAAFLGGQQATGDQAFNAAGELNVTNLQIIAVALT